MANDKLVRKVFYSYLTMSILTMVVATAGMLVDGIVIGQMLGQKCVSAFGLTSPISLLVAVIAGIFSNGGSACCSAHIGRGDEEGVKRNFTVACLCVGILFRMLLMRSFLYLTDLLVRMLSSRQRNSPERQISRRLQ